MDDNTIGGDNDKNNELNINTTGIKFMLPISVQAMMFHHSIPNIMQLMGGGTSESDASQIFGVSMSICLILYMSLGHL